MDKTGGFGKKTFILLILTFTVVLFLLIFLFSFGILYGNYPTSAHVVFDFNESSNVSAPSIDDSTLSGETNSTNITLIKKLNGAP